MNTTSKAYDSLEFVFIMAKETPKATLAQLAELMRLSRRHGRLQERACNERVAEGHDARCEAAIRKVCTLIGCVPTFSGDLRGCTVKVAVPSGRSNSWGGEGICVPQ